MSVAPAHNATGRRQPTQKDSMPKLITKQSEVPDATDEELLAAYQHYSGKVPRAFASRAIAERKVVVAIMANADVAGHLGVARGAWPTPIAWWEIVDKAHETRRADPRMLAREGLGLDDVGVKFEHEVNPYPPETMAHRLWSGAAVHTVAPPPPRSPSPGPSLAKQHKPLAPASKPTQPRASAGDPTYVATGRGTANVLPSSERGKTLALLVSAGPAGLPLSAITAAIGPGARGHLGKLRATDHVTLLEGSE